MAKGKTEIGELLRKAKHAPDTLTVDEFEEVQRLQKMKRRPAPEPRPEPEPIDRRRRVTPKYRAHLDAIAQIYVRAGEVRTDAARAVVAAHPYLKGFRPARFLCWEDNPEWLAALQAARIQAAAQKALPPETRGARLLAFAQTALAEIETAYDLAKHEGDESEKKALEARIIKLHDALRAEERHQDNLATQARLRSMKHIMQTMVALCRESSGIDDYLRRLLVYRNDPAKLLGVRVE